MRNGAVAFDHHIETRERLRAAIVRELEFTLIALSLSASICSARAFLRPLSDDVDAASYMPGEPRLTSAASLSITDPGISPDACFELAHLNGRVHEARSVTQTVAVVAAAQSIERSPMAQRTPSITAPADWVDASSHWRRAAAAGISTLLAINASTNSSQSADGLTDGTLVASELEKLLRDIVSGASPCIDADGHVQYPQWAERRRHQRHRLAVPATLYLAKLADQIPGCPVTIRDASSGGFGLVAPGLGKSHMAMAGTRISVVTNDGRGFNGVVVWAADDQIGIRLLEPLFANDPLFAARGKRTTGSMA